MIDNSVFVPAMIAFFAIAAVTAVAAAYGLILAVREIRTPARAAVAAGVRGRELVRAA